MGTLQSELSDIFGYSFRNCDLLCLALTHSSLGKENYERLEFLGDGVVNLAAASLLFQRFPDLREGDLSRLRSFVVNKSALGEIAEDLQLGDYVRLAPLRDKPAPVQISILSDVFEALLGVIFLESGFEKASEVASCFISPLLEGLDPELSKDPKTKLQEFLQAKKIDLPEYTIVEEVGLSHKRIFKVSCRVPSLGLEGFGVGRSRRLAEQEAASMVLSRLNDES